MASNLGEAVEGLPIRRLEYVSNPLQIIRDSSDVVLADETAAEDLILAAAAVVAEQSHGESSIPHHHHPLEVGFRRNFPQNVSFHGGLRQMHEQQLQRALSPSFSSDQRSAAILASKKINNEQWEAMFERLLAYKAEFGDTLVPKRYAKDPKLGTWVETQRVQYKRLQREIDEASGMESVQPNKRLNQERLAKLEAIGFAWSAKGKKVKSPPEPLLGSLPPGKIRKISVEDARAQARNRLNDSQWEEMYQRLAQYKAKYGDTLVPRKYEADPRLATWVETQRVLWNRDYREGGDMKNVGGGSGSITPPSSEYVYTSSAAHLPDEKVPEAWEDELEDERQNSMLGSHKLPAHSHANMNDYVVTMAHATDGDELTLHEMERLPSSATAAMTEEEAQHAAVVAAAAEAAAEVVDSEAKLDAFAQPKRLTRERKEKLDALGFVWSLRSKRIEDHWDEMFRQLVEYKEAHGDCLVPSRYEKNLKLGKWVETQRYEYTKLLRTSAGESNIEMPDGDSKPRATNPRLTEERLRRLESIGFEWKVKHKMKRYYDKQWDQMFDRLLKFKEANGHCMVPKRYPPDMKLGTWVHTQRIQYRKMVNGKGVSDLEYSGTDEPKTEEEVSYRLTEDRRIRLEEIGFIWSGREGEKADSGRLTRNSYDDQWDVMFARLQAYKDKYGDVLVPKRFREDPKLGTWVDTQRVQYKKMKKKLAERGVDYDGPVKMEEEDDEESDDSPGVGSKPVIGRLTDDRIRRLEALGFVWSLRDDWQKHYEELKDFKAEHGHCNVPARYAKNRRLGIWVSAQRQQYKLMQGPDDPRQRRSAPLTQERVSLLNDLGFTWTIRSRDSLGESWNQRFQELRQFKAVHGHCLVPSRYPPNPELGVWVGTQRTQYRLYMRAKQDGRSPCSASAMNEDRIRQLEEQGFVWALRGDNNKKDSLEYQEEDIGGVGFNHPSVGTSFAALSNVARIVDSGAARPSTIAGVHAVEQEAMRVLVPSNLGEIRKLEI